MNGKEERIRSFFRAYEQRFNDTLKDPPVVDIQGRSTASPSSSSPPTPMACAAVGTAWPSDGRSRTASSSTGRSARDHGRDRARDHSLGDDLHFVAKVGWDSRYTRKDGEEVRIDFVNTYFVRVEDEEPKIFGYVTGDERRRCSKNTA
jgi:hypothetical protein